MDAKMKKGNGSLTYITGWLSSQTTEIGCLSNWLIDRLTDTDWLVDCLSREKEI